MTIEIFVFPVLLDDSGGQAVLTVLRPASGRSEMGRGISIIFRATIAFLIVAR